MDNIGIMGRKEANLSVIIPSKFENLDYVKSAIDSIERNTVIPKEVIIVDDSQKGLHERIKEEYSGLLNLIFVNNEYNMGACASRNIGVLKSKMDWVMLLDDDDLFTSDRIELLFKYARDESATMVGSQSARFEIDVNQATPSKPLNNNWVDVQKLFEGNFLGASVLVRKDVYLASGGFDPKMIASQDHDAYVRMLNYSQKAFFINRVTYYSRQHSGEYRISNNKVVGYLQFCIKHRKKISLKMKLICILKVSESLLKG